jgi:hypothetical protein
MIGRAKHYTATADGTKMPDPVFVTNREKVYEIIAKMTCNHSCWTYIKPAQKTRNGLHGIVLAFPWPQQRRKYGHNGRG